MFALVTAACLATSGDATGGVIRLADYQACGLTSLYLACRLKNADVTWDEIRNDLGPPAADGTHSFADLARVARSAGLRPVGVRVDRARLDHLPMPAIVQVTDVRKPGNPAHLLVLLRTEPTGVVLLDAPMPAYFLPNSEFEAVWSGHALLFPDTDAEAEALSRGPLVPSRWAAWGVVGCGLLLAVTLVRRFRSRLALGRSLRWTGVCSVLIVLGVALFAVAGPFSPKCTLQAPVLDLGELQLGGFDTTVAVRNDGRRELQFADIRSSCTCAVVTAPTHIPPGGSAALTLRLNVTGGAQQTRVQIKTNDPTSPHSVLLRWRGTSKPVLDPPLVVEHRAPGERPYERVVKVVYPAGTGGLPATLQGVHCDSDRVRVTAGENRPLALKYATGPTTSFLGELDLRLTVLPGQRPDRFEKPCPISVRVGGQPYEMKIPVAVNFEGGAIRPEVSSVTLVGPHDHGGQDRVVKVRHEPGNGPVVVGSRPDWLRVDAVPVGEHETALRLSLSGVPPGPLTRVNLPLGFSDRRGLTALDVFVFNRSPFGG